MYAMLHVNTIQQKSETSSMILPFRCLSANDPQKGAEKISMNGRIPIRSPVWMEFMPSCLK